MPDPQLPAGYSIVEEEPALPAGYTEVKKKASAAGSGNGEQPYGFGLSPFQSSPPLTPSVVTEKYRPTPYVKPATKPKTIPEAVEDDDNYLGAIWNQVVNSGSDFVGGMTRLIAKNSPVPGLSGAGDVLGEKVESTLRQVKSDADEEKIQQGFDLTNGISMDDAKALPLLITRFAADLGLAIPTAGASFIAQGYNQGLKEYDTATQGKETDANTRELFGAAYGVINGLADRVSLGFLTKNNPVAKSVKKAILRETIGELAKKSGKITADVIEETASQVARKSFSKLKSVGVKGLTSAGVEAGTEGLQGAGTDALKLLTNKLADQEVFNKEEVVENFIKNRINDMGAGGILGGIAGAGMRGIQSSNDVIATRVAEATTPAEVEAIKAEIADSSLDPERATALIESVDKFAEATAKLPSTLTATQRKKAIETIVERDKVNEAIAAQVEQAAVVDEALAPQVEQETAILEAKKQSLNDNIVEITTEQKFKYFKDPEKDKWYKQLGEDGVAEEITEQQYRLEKQSAPREVDTTPEALTKAETDLEALKQVTDKVRKYDASLKRLTDAKNAGTITENEFNDMKKRFDEVMGAAAPTITTTQEEIVTPNTEIDAVQEQITDEVSVQPEAAPGREVAEGVPAAGLEVVTEQSETLPQGEGEIGFTAKDITEKLSKQQDELIQSVYDNYEGEEASRKIKELFASKEYKDIEDKINQLNPVGADLEGFEKSLSKTDAKDYAQYQEIGYRLVAADKDNGYRPFKVTESEKKRYAEYKQKFDAMFAEYKKSIDSENIKTVANALGQPSSPLSQGEGEGVINAKERTKWKEYKVGDEIDGSELSRLSGDLVDGEKGDKFVLAQVPLSDFEYTKNQVLELDAVDAEDGMETERLEGIIESFDKTPPIPNTGDGMHRIVAAKELGHETILMWKPVAQPSSPLSQAFDPIEQAKRTKKTEKGKMEAGGVQPTKITGEELSTPKALRSAGFNLAFVQTPSGKFRIVELNSKKPLGKLYDTKEQLLEDFEKNKNKITPERVKQIIGEDKIGEYDAGEQVNYVDKIGENASGKIVGFENDRYIIQKSNGVKDIVPTANIKTEPVVSDLVQDRKAKFAAERIQVQRTTPTGAPKKINTIIADLAKALKAPLIYAKSRRGRALGSYNPTNALVNLRNAGDVDTAAHEIGHLVDDRFDLTGTAPTGTDTELKWLSDRGGSNPPKGLTSAKKKEYLQREGLAEFIRAYIVNPMEAKQVAPILFDHFENTANKETLDAIKAFSQDYLNLANAPAGDQILSNIMEAPTLKDKTSVIDWLLGRSNSDSGFQLTWADGLKSQISDALHASKKAFDYAKNLKGIATLLPEKNFETMSRLFAGINGKLDRIFESGMVNAKNEYLKDNGKNMTVQWLFEPLDSSSKKAFDQETREVMQYMVAQRTVEYASKLGRRDNLTGVGAGIRSDIAVANEHLADFEQMRQTNPDKADRIEEAARRYRAYADAGLRYAVDKGRLSQENYQAIKDNNKYYVSLARVKEVAPTEEPLAQFNQFSKGGLTSVKDVIKTAKGGTGTIQNPYISLLKNTADLVSESDRNEVLQTFVDVLTDERGMGEGAPKTLAEIGRPVQSGEKNTKTVFVDGVPQKWQFSEGVYKSLTGLEQLNSVPALLKIPGQVLRWTVTHFPAFAVKNVIRDTQSRLILSRSGSGVKDMLHSLKDREVFDLYGASQSGYHLKSREAYYDSMAKATKKLTSEGGIILDPRKLGDLGRSYVKFLEKSENVNRIAEFKSAYKKAKAEGMDDYNAGLYAAYEARDMLDFAVAGHMMRVVNQIVPFTNAAIQGLKRTAKGVKENPKAFAVNVALYAVVPQVIVRAINYANGDDEEYEQLPWYQRDFFYNFKTPLTGGKWISIPKAFDLGVLSSAVDRGMSAAMGHEKAFDNYDKSMISAVMPIDEGAAMSIFRPLTEIAANKDMFRDQPIVPHWEEKLMLNKREGTKYASRLGKMVSDGFGLVGVEADPRYIDHAIRGFASYYGDFAMRLSNIGSDNSKQIGIEQTGLVREQAAANARDVSATYRLAEKLGVEKSKDVQNLKRLVKEFYSSESESERTKVLEKLNSESSKVRAKMEDAYRKSKDVDVDSSVDLTVKNAEGDEVWLSAEQLTDRQKFNDEYVKLYAEQRQKALASAGKSKGEIAQDIEKKANKYSESKLKQKYKELLK